MEHSLVSVVQGLNSNSVFTFMLLQTSSIPYLRCLLCKWTSLSLLPSPCKAAVSSLCCFCCHSLSVPLQTPLPSSWRWEVLTRPSPPAVSAPEFYVEAKWHLLLFTSLSWHTQYCLGFFLTITAPCSSGFRKLPGWVWGIFPGPQPPVPSSASSRDSVDEDFLSISSPCHLSTPKLLWAFTLLCGALLEFLLGWHLSSQKSLIILYER